MSKTAVKQDSEVRSQPRPVVKKMRWPFPLIWVVPVAALAAAGFYLRDYVQERGAEVTVTFADATGLEAGQTLVKRHGVEIGKVWGLKLSDDQQNVDVQLRLHGLDTPFARQGALFWVVRPEISAGSISGLSTVVSGPYIEATPGTGSALKEFQGLEKPPVNLGDGLKVTLYTSNLEHLQRDSPVYYRGIQVGVIQNIQLSNDSSRVNIGLFIWRRYTQLLRSNSQFWIVSGADVKGGIFTGVKLELESLRALISGGVAFATPDLKPGEAAKEGAAFPLHDEPKDEWLKWSAQLPLEPGEAGQNDPQTDLQQGQAALRSAQKPR